MTLYSQLQEHFSNTNQNRQIVKEFALNYFKSASLEEAYQKSGMKNETACLGFFAGSGTRWVKSLKALDISPKKVNPMHPRCMAKIDNLIPGIKLKKVSIGCYNLYAFKNLGDIHLIDGNFRELIEKEICKPLGVKVNYLLQKFDIDGIPVYGHGEALRQFKDVLKNYKYIITFFSNEPHSRETIIISLLCFKIFLDQGLNISHLIPVTYSESPPYRAIIDENNIPMSACQPKLKGDCVESTAGYSNIGVRLYLNKELTPIINKFEKILFKKKSYKSLNTNGNNEFGLDHIDDEIMKARKSRLLPICYPYELNCAKSYGRLPLFLEAIKQIYHQ